MWIGECRTSDIYKIPTKSFISYFPTIISCLFLVAATFRANSDASIHCIEGLIQLSDCPTQFLRPRITAQQYEPMLMVTLIFVLCTPHSSILMIIISTEYNIGDYPPGQHVHALILDDILGLFTQVSSCFQSSKSLC